MRRSMTVRSSAAALATAAVDMASAANGCGRGYYFDGYRCVPERRAYAPPPVYGGGYDRGYDRPRSEGRRRGGDSRCPNGGVYMRRPGTGVGCY